MSRYTDSTFSNPITKSGRVVYNVCVDLDHARWRSKPPTSRYAKVEHCSQTVNDNVLSIMPHEICLQQDQSQFKRGFTRSINDTEVQLLSCLNGLKTKVSNKEGKRAEQVRRKIRQTLKFGGVAATDAKYSEYKFKPVANDAMFVSQFGGLCTIMNTGTDTIYAGDYVVWDLPNKPNEGTGLIGCKEKQLVITRPHRPQGMSAASLQFTADNDPDLKASMDGTIKSIVNTGDVNDASRKNLAEGLSEVLDHILEERSRVIGRALQMAKTGETFDLLLGRYIA